MRCCDIGHERQTRSRTSPYVPMHDDRATNGGKVAVQGVSTRAGRARAPPWSTPSTGRGSGGIAGGAALAVVLRPTLLGLDLEHQSLDAAHADRVQRLDGRRAVRVGPPRGT